MTQLRHILATSAAVILVGATTQAAADTQGNGPTLTIENFVGVITINTASGHTLEVSKSKNDRRTSVNADKNALKIDGGINRPDGDDCKNHYGKLSWSWNDSKTKTGKFGGYKNLEDYPEMTITAPRDTHFVLRNSIAFGTLGEIGSADIELLSCGNLDIDKISGFAKFEITGSGDVNTGDLGDLDLSIRGSGDFEGNNAHNVVASVSGSGDIDLGDIHSGDFTISGSGDVEIGDVNGNLSISSRGSGDFSGDNVSGDLTYDGRGSGDFDVRRADGNISVESRGSGDVDIDGGDANTIKIRSSGSSNVDFYGTGETAELRASGSSDIYVKRVKGDTTQRESGSADITIGNK